MTAATPANTSAKLLASSIAPLLDVGAGDEEEEESLVDEGVEAEPVVNETVLVALWREREALLMVWLRWIEVAVPALAAVPTAVALELDAAVVDGAVELDPCEPPPTTV